MALPTLHAGYLQTTCDGCGCLYNLIMKTTLHRRTQYRAHSAHLRQQSLKTTHNRPCDDLVKRFTNLRTTRTRYWWRCEDDAVLHEITSSFATQWSDFEVDGTLFVVNFSLTVANIVRVRAVFSRTSYTPGVLLHTTSIALLPVIDSTKCNWIHITTAHILPLSTAVRFITRWFFGSR